MFVIVVPLHIFDSRLPASRFSFFDLLLDDSQRTKRAC
jgi:hypothetical protein